MNSYFFACDIDYQPNEHYYQALLANNIQEAVDKFIEIENKDRDEESKWDRENLAEGEIIDVLIEVTPEGGVTEYPSYSKEQEEVLKKIIKGK